MAVQMDNAALKIISGSYGNLFPTEKENSAKHKTKQQTRTVDKNTLQALHKQVFVGGVRTPLLKDIKPAFRHMASKFDSFENLTKFNLKDRKHFSACITSVPRLEKERTNLSLKTTGSTPKVFRFLLPNGSVKDSKTCTPDSEEADEWERWKNSVANAKDARDVLYRNTFCSERKVRYNTSTLPRIATERGNAVADHAASKCRKNLVIENNDDITHPVTIVPQPTRSKCISTRNQRGSILSHQSDRSDGTFFEVRRIKANTDLLKGTVGQYTTHVRQPIELQTSSNIHYQNRFDRPLKYECGRYLPMSRRPQAYLNMSGGPQSDSKRDYKSVETYKQYLEKSQSGEIRKSRTADKENSELSQYGYENRILQSVIDVNVPKKEDMTRLPGKSPEEDVVSEENILHTNRSATNKSNKSIIIEIKPTWREKIDGGEKTDNLNNSNPEGDTSNDQPDQGAD